MTILSLSLGLSFYFFGCSLPKKNHETHDFPSLNAWTEELPDHDVERLGQVRAKVEYESLGESEVERWLCQNYYNKAVLDLLNLSQAQGGDAVMKVESVVFLLNGKSQTFKTPECVDYDGSGQILVQGIAIKLKKKKKKTEKSVRDGFFTQKHTNTR